MKVSIYARESSDDTGKAPPIAKQIEIGKQWVQSQGHELTTIFADNGFSGGDWKRPDWQKSIREAKRHSYTILWVWNQDRIARDTEQFLFYYRNLKNAFVRIYDNSINDFINMDDLGGRVKHTTLAQAAEIFRIVTSDKVKATYKAKKEKEGDNLRWGRPKKNLDISKIISLRKQGLGYRIIAKEIGCSYQTIRRILLQNTHSKSTIENTPKIGG